jgi:hypothetical protein
MKTLRSILLLLLIFFAGWWLLSRLTNLPSLSNIFKQQEVVIDKTAVLVTNIKALAQLVTITAYNEIVVDSTSNGNGAVNGLAALYPALAPALQSGEKKIVLIGKTTTHVGLDLQKINVADVRLVKDSLHITLPPAEVLDVILNPSDLEIFDEKGSWSTAAIANLKNKIAYIAVQNAKSLGLLAQSEAKAKDVLASFFKAAGYSKIGFSFK